jgi:hypothetical protein
MSRLIRTLTLLLTLSLLLASCRPQTAGRRPQADGGQPTAPSPTLTLSPSPTPTEIPQPSLESLGLTAEIQQMFTRQGWQIKWDSQNARYTISQRAFDEATQKFTSQKTHEVGYIDLEGNLHTRLTRFSATENPDGTWTDTSTTQDLVIPLINQNASNPEPATWNLPTWNLIETKNPAFEKTGILTLTYLDENGIPQTVTYNRELNFLEIPEISTDLLHPTPIPIEAVHSLAALQFILLRYGEGEPFPTDNFPGWSLQFYYESNGTKQAILWPRSGETSRYIRFIGENDFNIPWFMIVLPDGTAYPSAPVEIFNPKDPQNPADGNEKLLLFPVFLGKMSYPQRYFFNLQYLKPTEFNALFKQRILTLAQEGGYFSKTNIGKWTDFYNPSSLDSLLGMEGNDVKTQLWEQSNGGYANISGNLGYLEQLNEKNKLLETAAMRYMLPPALEKLVLVISP